MKIINFFRQLKLCILSLFRGKIYYINGTDNLPPPLTTEEEEQLIADIDKGDSRNILIEHNLRLVVYIAKRFENTGVGIEELISIGTVGLIKAITTFNNDKNIKLATYASRCIENEILMYLRKNSNMRNEVSIEEPLNIDWDGNELLLSDVLGGDADEVAQNLESEMELEFLQTALSRLNPREQDIMRLRYGLADDREYTQKEVADMLGISQSYISRLEKKILERLKKELESIV